MECTFRFRLAQRRCQINYSRLHCVGKPRIAKEGLLKPPKGIFGRFFKSVDFGSAPCRVGRRVQRVHESAGCTGCHRIGSHAENRRNRRKKAFLSVTEASWADSFQRVRRAPLWVKACASCARNLGNRRIGKRRVFGPPKASSVLKSANFDAPRIFCKMRSQHVRISAHRNKLLTSA
jgi:hypothetical protein